MNLFTQNEIWLMIGVVSVLLVCISILTIFDIKEYFKNKKVSIDEADFKEEFKEKEEPVSKVVVEEVVDKEIPDEVLINDVKNEDIFLEEMEDEKFDVEEVNVVKEEPILSKTDTVVKTNVETNIESNVKEKKKLDILEELEELEANLPNKKDDVTNFEMEQERTAIISLDELMKKSDELYDSNEVMQYDDGNEPISIDEVIKMFNRDLEEEKEVPIIMQDIVEEKEPYSKKETIPFISSVYGIEKKDNALEFENTATYEKLDRANYNDFIAKLREMNENK